MKKSKVYMITIDLNMKNCIDEDEYVYGESKY